MPTSHGRRHNCAYSVGQGGKDFIFSKTGYVHQDYLTVGTELKTFPAEPSTATVHLLKEAFHQQNNQVLKPCCLDSFVPQGVTLMWCTPLSSRSGRPWEPDYCECCCFSGSTCPVKLSHSRLVLIFFFRLLSISISLPALNNYCKIIILLF